MLALTIFRRLAGLLPPFAGLDGRSIRFCVSHLVAADSVFLVGFAVPCGSGSRPRLSLKGLPHVLWMFVSADRHLTIAALFGRAPAQRGYGFRDDARTGSGSGFVAVRGNFLNFLPGGRASKGNIQFPKPDRVGPPS